MNDNIYRDYMSIIYSSAEREKNIEKEYENMFYWNKKYIVPFIAKEKNAQILDIGCGLGQNLYTLKKLGYKNVKGIDLSPECVSFCSKKGFDAEKISAEEFLSEKENYYDLITIYHVMEHIKKEKTVDFLKILVKSLKPGGVLVINVPNANNAIGGCHDRYVDITHEILFTPESMQEILVLAGFEKKNIQIKELVAYSPNDKRLLQKIIKKIILPVLTCVVDLIWYVFFLSQGIGFKKNRPVLVSISRKE